MSSPTPRSGLFLRSIILLVLASFVFEFIVPVALFAQPQGGPTVSAPVKDELPPMQEAEAIAAPPFYKRWWFWTLVGVVVVGGVAIAAAGGGGGGNGNGGSGSVSANW
jgi:hypothetical protein